MDGGASLMEPVDPDAFECIETGRMDEIGKFSPDQLRPFVPVLTRAGLLHQSEAFAKSSDFVQPILLNLIQNEAANNIVSLLQLDYQNLEMDVKKELQLRQKLGNREQDSILVQNLSQGITLEFEKAEGTRKLRLILSEILFILSQMIEPRQEYYIKMSDLFDNWVYMDDICDALSIAMVEMPNILSICDICEAMLHVKYGQWIITRLVANMPDSFSEVCFHLISNGDKCEEDTEGGLIRLDAMKMLCKMNPKQSLLIRSRCVEMNKMPALAVFVSLEAGDTENNLVPFLSGILLGNDQPIRNWFSVYVRNGQKRKSDAPNSLSNMRESIFTYLRQILEESRKEGNLNNGGVVKGSSLLRLLCALKGIAGFKFHEDEISHLVSFITLRAPITPQGSRFIILGLCTLLACPSLLSTPEQERVIIEWIRSLIKIEYSTGADAVSASFGEILLLMAIHFHSNQLSAISDLVCTTLGMKIAIRVNTMARIKQIFIQDIFTEQVVTAHAVRVPVTPSLSGDLSGFLPVHCIYQLIKSRAFTKHKVPIKDWIYRQILTTCFPIHSVLPALLEVYTQSILLPTSSTIGGAKVELTNEPLSDDEVLSAFQSFQNKRLAPQLLILYYVLLYEDNRLNNCRNLVHSCRSIKSYSGKLFSQIPIKFLLQEAQKNQNQCGGLFPSLLKLLTTHFPQLCIANEWLEDNLALADDEPVFSVTKCTDIDISPDSFEQAFLRVADDPEDSIRLLEICKQLTPHKLWSYSKDIVSQVRKVAQPSVSRKIQDLFREVWYKLNNVYPRHLWEITSNALLTDGSLHLTADELTVDPLQVLRCDTRVFRCAPILDILLHILAASLAASRYFLWKHLQENPSMVAPGPNPQSDGEREELKVALVAVQESAAVQILLEACLPNEGDKAEGISCDLTLKEIQSLICSFLHQMFIADPTLAKLVHFQGYPLELLPVTVRGIPSMHICLDFIPELLSQPEMEKQVFAAQLISYLSMQYALPKSFSIARIAVTTMNGMASGLMSEERAEFFIPALSALERLCVTFPPLVDDIVALLMHLGKICTAQNAVERNRMSRIVRNKQLLKKINETYCHVVQYSMKDRHVM
ncbi:integrator complex subunit 2 isoform X2 [Folsomia candida]|uniref:integrator complex subunit 2 isoform X2 n=1 Tax=Folsomia candida TaxID=158441 RepID=UPI000B8FFA56|nr:integrator complex subunit 2 isoform X2 [Folsomia candida]